MAKTFDGIDDKLGRFLADQPVFFVATAPSGPDGHVNLSPKGVAGTFRILDPRTVAYLDFTGSGIETVAHLRDNGRIVIMFCAFAGPPRIVRLYGRGTVVLPGDSDWEDLAARFPPQPGSRSVIKVALERGLLRLRRPPHDLRPGPPPTGRVGHPEIRGRAGRLPGQEERREHRRFARSARGTGGVPLIEAA